MKNPRRGPTIYDVAEQAGVATSTVSRAFSNPDRVNATTREHVLDVAKRLGYRPNPLARSLPSGRTRTVALLVADITNPHYFEMIRGAERRAKAAGLTLILVNTEESAQTERNQIERLSRSVDGFILASSRMSDETIRGLQADYNIALVSRELDGLPSVEVDHVEGCQQIVQHLASLGHRSVVFLAGPRVSWLALHRWRAIFGAAKRLGMRATKLGPFSPTVSSGGAAADAALGCGATAVVAYNDLLAIGALRRFADRGVAVPGDISVVGFDDIFASDLCTPG
ncbi:MAG: LacI family DNA-binding transcriptional regulator, partial [Streptosporangiaceae bacterium]